MEKANLGIASGILAINFIYLMHHLEREKKLMRPFNGF